MFHGTLNAAATLVIFLKGENALVTGITGAIEMITLLLANGALWLHLRRSRILLDNRVGQ